MSNSNNPSWAWLGLLKWSLAYQDGTSSEAPTPMSADDKAFLEEVMTHGIVNEGERMKEILTALTTYLEQCKHNERQLDNLSSESNDEAISMLLELRDIVEQIDYARAFVALNGLPFLLGCATQKVGVRIDIRAACISCLSTLAQNNPPVQQALLDLDGVHHLAEIYFDDECDWNIKGKSVQAINAIVRGHKAAEELFSNDHVCRLIILTGLRVTTQSQGQVDAEIVPTSVRRRCLFFLRAITCSDFSSRNRVRLFEDCFSLVFPLIDPEVEEDNDIRQMALDLILETLYQRKSVNYIMSQKQNILAVGVPRVSYLRSLSCNSEEKELGDMELDTWESLIVEIAKDPTDDEHENGQDEGTQVLMLENHSSNDNYRSAPQ